MINCFLGAAMMAVPFFIKSGPKTAPNLSQEWLFAILAVLGPILLGLERAHRNIVAMAGMLFLVAFLSSNPFGIFQYYQLGMCFCGILFIAFVYSHRKSIDQKLLARIFGAVCLIQSAWILANYAGVDPFFEWLKLIGVASALEKHAIMGSLGNINQSGALVACTLPFLRFWYWPLPVAALFIGGSALPVICAITGAVALISYTKKSYMALKLVADGLVLAAIAMACGIFPVDSYFSGGTRVQAWTKFIDEVGILGRGHGLGWVSQHFTKFLFKGERFYQLHNEWLELYAIGGLLSVVAGLYLCVPLFKNKGNPAMNACLLSLLVNSLGNFTFHVAPLFMVFGTCYALQLDEE